MKKLIIKGMDKRYFPEKLAGWYETNKRSLPWRTTRDPYRIWLSEVILQQTRVSQGLPYYTAFVKKFPTVRHLARAREQEVLRLWQGLGYYTRARNLHKCAKEIVAHHQGKFPTSYAALRQLPGIGDYTAAAIASFSFREPVAVVDGNVFRLLSRLSGIETPVNSAAGKKVFATLANELISRRRPDIHNQAMMEFGATVCLPKNPLCETCPFRKSCAAFAQHLQGLLPVKTGRKVSRQRHFYYFVLEKGKSVLMRKRSEGDIWTGLYDFYLVEKDRPVTPARLLEELTVKNGQHRIRVTKPYKHVLTHQTIISTFIILPVGSIRISGLKDHAFYSLTQIGSLPKPALVTRFLKDHYLL